MPYSKKIDSFIIINIFVNSNNLRVKNKDKLQNEKHSNKRNGRLFSSCENWKRSIELL